MEELKWFSYGAPIKQRESKDSSAHSSIHNTVQYTKN